MSGGIPGDPDAIEAAAAALGRAGHDLGDAATDAAAVPKAIPAAWTGSAAQAGVAATSKYGPAVDAGADSCASAQRVLHTYAHELRAAQAQYATAQKLVAKGLGEPGGLVPGLPPLDPASTSDSPGARDVAAGQAGMREALAAAERANHRAARQIDALVTALDAMKAPMPRSGKGTDPAAPFGHGKKPTYAPPDGKQCAETLSCTVDDFQQLSIAQRQEFMRWFERLHGGTLDVKGRYANVGGVLRFLRDDHLGKQGTWVSWVDASILHGIERGAATSLGLPGGTQGNKGAASWKKYFDYVRRTHDNDSDHADGLWRDGEENSTANGYNVAKEHGTRPSGPEQAFADGGAFYRWIVKHESDVKQAVSGIPGAPWLVDHVFDPGSPTISYYGGHIIHGGAEVGQGGYHVLDGLLHDHDLGETWNGLKEGASGIVELQQTSTHAVVSAGKSVWHALTPW